MMSNGSASEVRDKCVYGPILFASVYFASFDASLAKRAVKPNIVLPQTESLRTAVQYAHSENHHDIIKFFNDSINLV